MCLNIQNVLKFFGLFPQTTFKMPSFADSFVQADHTLDDRLSTLFSKVSFTSALADFNPEPRQELFVFNMLNQDQPLMLKYNALMLSRIFITNAKNAKLVECFAGKTTIKICSVGCGYSPELLGLLALFNSQGIGVSYTGIDTNSEKITTCKDMYRNLNSTTNTIKFISKDARTILTSDNCFDLILIAHPNLSEQDLQPVFKAVFLSASNALEENGRIYSTLYYGSEKTLFQDTIHSQLGNMKGDILTSNCFAKFKITDRHTNEKYAPENYIFLSAAKKPELTNSLKKTN